MDNNGKTTHGPWVATPTGADWIQITPHDDGQMLAGVHPNKYLDGDLDANANLIAAAPDLLDALEDVLDALGFLSGNNGELTGHGMSEDRAQEIRNIVAKARGEEA